jgi:uncharacterized protein YcbX
MAITVTELYRYPVKSCRGELLREAALDDRGFVGDRAFLVVDETGTFLTQREFPGLCLIDPVVEEDRVTLRAPGSVDLEFPIRDGLGDCEVTVWNDRCLAVDQGDAVAQWLEHRLGVPARLARLAAGFVRRVDATYAVRWTDQVHFGDGFPVLLINAASLDDLNRRMGLPLPVNRFRPNIVVGGAPAYAEDGWRQLRIGEVIFHVVKPCSRCAVTQVDQATAALGKEPLRTLASYRLTPTKQVLFGQYLIHAGPGVVRVGDPVEVIA